MKNRISGIVLLLVLAGMNLSMLSAQSLKGKWQGASEGEVGMMTFDKQGYVSFVVGGEPYGGRNFKAEGLSMYMKYHTDDSIEPHTVDFVMYMSDDVEVARMLGIYKFVDPKTLILNMDFDGIKRPEKFDPEDPNQITLSKTK